MISRMQLPREMYMGGGISSLPYPSYGYAGGGITNSPNYMGGGYIDEYGRQRYGFGKFVSKITKPIAKVLDKIVPNEIKPALPFIAAALPFTQFGAGLFAKLGSLGGLASSQLAPYIGAGIIGAGSQMAQEGFDERGFNLPGLALSTLGGGAAASGTLGLGAGLREGIIAGNIGDKAITASDFATQFPGYTGPKTLEALSQMTDYAVAPFADPTPLLQDLPISSATIYPGATSVTGPDFLQSAENLTRSTAAASSDYLGEGSKSLGRLTSGDFSKVGGDLVTVGKTLGPGQIGATMETADRFARDALDEYNRQQAALGQTVAQSKADQIFFIRQAMQQAGFNEDEIASAITRSGFMYGGKVEYKEGGLMNLKMSGMPAEMDLRKGGFVPLGKKERADDVPARLSKNEFVFTAKAVRNAGGGDVRKGAKRMYKIMNQLEAKA